MRSATVLFASTISCLVVSLDPILLQPQPVSCAQLQVKGVLESLPLSPPVSDHSHVACRKMNPLSVKVTCLGLAVLTLDPFMKMDP